MAVLAACASQFPAHTAPHASFLSFVTSTLRRRRRRRRYYCPPLPPLGCSDGASRWTASARPPANPDNVIRWRRTGVGRLCQAGGEPLRQMQAHGAVAHLFGHLQQAAAAAALVSAAGSDGGESSSAAPGVASCPLGRERGLSVLPALAALGKTDGAVGLPGKKLLAQEFGGEVCYRSVWLSFAV